MLKGECYDRQYTHTHAHTHTHKARADIHTICCIIQPYCQCLLSDSQGINLAFCLLVSEMSHVVLSLSFLLSTSHSYLLFLKHQNPTSWKQILKQSPCGIIDNGSIDYGSIKSLISLQYNPSIFVIQHGVVMQCFSDVVWTHQERQMQ